ncbi:Putative tRNA-m1A22 methylase [Fructilactobacillus florum 8D]|uniref:Putative tRNA-m1A22 methylase n=1 Tax=Fructilactobacillus florum 8D TaxID=1221538 RepID=W9EIN8_9LACO|nr:class I SAM-dependent methyltransferase [Fructilactobacillus florum]EKK20185.1 Putative tRNA-m1A22 methylase [Fructilactobacillus florum 2F]ETO40870.1 Putative tRNA-m1A22 methylase [Fructilactobacillus florum 8D]
MDAKHLSKRLQAVADVVEPATLLADIGSDHAYLPAFLVQTGRVQRAVAGELRSGPLHNAQTEIDRLQLQARMQARLGDGLTVLKSSDHCQTITIAGMGGALIADILQRGQSHLQDHPQLVLQPNIDEDLVRTWLAAHHYRIKQEQIIFDGGHYYEVIAASYTSFPVNYDRKDLLFGPLLRRAHNEIFTKKWEKRIVKLDLIIDQLAAGENQARVQAIRRRRREIQEVLS